MIKEMADAADRLERTRVREVSRYYCATKFPVDNTLDGDAAAGSSCDGGPEPFPAADGPLRPVRLSPDPAMTAFAQLTSHKLDCKRAFINIIDHKTHHVVAEATKTVSLEKHDQHAPDDQLYCGLQALPIAWGICPSTIHVFSHPNSEYAISTSNITSNMSSYVIRDLSREEAYSERPYVAQWPFMRFYAEVPLKSPAGFVIGSLAMVDDKPREGLTAHELATLQEISITIIQHLENIRLQHDSQHAGRLMQGLSAFVKAGSEANRLESTPRLLPQPEERTPALPEFSESLNVSNGYRAGQAPNTIFSRASSLIRQSMDLEGVIFFDARRSLNSSVSKQPFCENLGFSTKSDVTMTDGLVLSQALLQRLSTNFSTGKIFNFDELGLVTADSDDNPADTNTIRTASETDAALLSATFPGAHSIIFFPLQGAKASYYAGCFGWTFDAKRALQTEEITYFSAFSNSVMSEIFRLEAVAMDRAKSNFISSISHELRSPLHGILASAELLQACSSGSDQDSLIHMVDICGRTLLDTMNHLFDYAKITNSPRSGSTQSSDRLSLSMSTHSTLNLSKLVEEVVEAVYTGHNFAKASSATSPHINGATTEPPPVMIILDIAAGSDWVFKTEAGAWRRVAMNLFGNALKYTKSGSIRISLRVNSGQHDCKGVSIAMVEFQVSDTGRGISQDYLKNRLYTPFAQEDSLSVGTGLGLSIVRGVVTALGGSMDVQSEIDYGTTVTVSVPVEMLPANGDLPTLASSNMVQSIKSKRRTFALLETDGQRNIACQSATTYVVQTVSQWLDFERIPPGSEAIPDLVIADEQKFLSYDGASSPGADTAEGDRTSTVVKEPSPYDGVPHLILCTGPPGEPTCTNYRQKRISQPFGPHKLTNAIADLLSLQIMAGTPVDANGRNEQKRPLKRSYEDMEDSSMFGQAETASKHLVSGVHSLASTNGAKLGEKGLSTFLLLVDDNDINLKIMSTYLRKLFCRYKTASNGLEAVESYQRAYSEGSPIEVILMDMSMPVMDGFEATRQIRAFERRRHILPPSRIIALTGLTSGRSQQDAMASGVDLFVTKPVQLKRLQVVLGLV